MDLLRLQQPSLLQRCWRLLNKIWVSSLSFISPGGLLNNGACYAVDLVVQSTSSEQILNSCVAVALTLDLEDQDATQAYTFPLESASLTSWKFDGVVEIPFNLVKLKIAMISVEVNETCFMELTKADIIKLEQHITTVDHVTRDLIGLDGTSPLTVSFSLALPTTELLERWRDENERIESLALAATEDEDHPEILLGYLRMLSGRSYAKPTLLAMCGFSFAQQYRRTSSQEYLVQAISLYTQAIRLTPEDHVSYLDCIYEALYVFSLRFEQTATSHDHDQLLWMTEVLVDKTPEGHPRMPERLALVGDTRRILSEHSGDLRQIDGAISILRTALQLLRVDDPRGRLGSSLDSLACSLMCSFTALGGDIDEAIALLQEALQSIAQDEEAACFSHLSNALLKRFDKTGQLIDLDNAISASRRAIDKNDARSEVPSSLHHLATCLMRRFENIGELGDLQEAISISSDAVQITDQNPAQLPVMLNILGNSLRHLFDRLGDPEDIHKAVSVLRRAVQMGSDEHSSSYAWHSNLGFALVRLFDHSGNLDDLSEAITILKEASTRTPDSNPELPVVFNQLGVSHLRRFERLGGLIDINNVALRTMMVLPQAAGHPLLFAWMDTLSAAIVNRFNLTGDRNDILEAVELGRSAVNTTPDGHPQLRMILNNLGLSLSARSEQDISSLSEAISMHRKSLELISEDDPSLPWALDNLALSLVRLSECGHSDGLAAANEAISLQERIVQLKTSPPEMPTHLSNLAHSLTARFTITKNLDDISGSISALLQSVRLTPDGHSSLPLYLLRLGDCLFERYNYTKSPGDLEDSIAFLRRSATYPSGPPKIRLNAATEWIRRCYKNQSNLHQAFEACGIAMDVCAEIVGLEQTIEMRHQHLLQVSIVASAAPEVALALGNLSTALEWVEQGRGVVWNQLNQLRTPIDDLQDYNPDLGSRMREVSRALDAAGSRQSSPRTLGVSVVQKKTLQDEASQHVKLAKEWESLLQQVRRIPRFHTFPRPRKCAAFLSRLPKEGPAIVLSENDGYFDALILISGLEEPMHVPLRQYSQDQARYLGQQLKSYLSSQGVRMREDDSGRGVRRRDLTRVGSFRGLLGALWAGIVKPLLDALAFEPTATRHRRIWWCATGALNFLPIHAAGIYENGGPSLSDYALSSYIPTISMLVDKVQKLPNPNMSKGRASSLLLISQPHAGDLPPIPGTTKEADMILRRYADTEVSTLHLDAEDATASRVESELASYSWIHLACHASQDTMALQSGFYMDDGRLTLSKIMQHHLPNAEFAFLSACQTSKGDEMLQHEAVHLAAGMLAAGYRGAVATVWSIWDEHGPDVADDFYAYLVKKGREELGCRDAAFALDYATRKLRERMGDSEDGMLAWVPYVHYGV